jgi:hypothetical protein
MAKGEIENIRRDIDKTEVLIGIGGELFKKILNFSLGKPTASKACLLRKWRNYGHSARFLVRNQEISNACCANE